jgi:hypothetical protein
MLAQGTGQAYALCFYIYSQRPVHIFITGQSAFSQTAAAIELLSDSNK